MCVFVSRFTLFAVSSLDMNIKPIAYFRGSFPTKFGIPRQSGIIEELCGTIVFEPEFRDANALRGLEAFDFMWIIWEFSANDASLQWHPTVRPPLLGGNRAVGVFATRSPFRPNRIGLSSVKILSIEATPECGMVVHVAGADLMDGTPIYDIKPYVAYTDCHPSARSGFVDENDWTVLNVDFPKELLSRIPDEFSAALMKVLALDPRPQYQSDPHKIYGMPFGNFDIRFKVSDAEGVLTVVDVVRR